MTSNYDAQKKAENNKNSNNKDNNNKDNNSDDDDEWRQFRGRLDAVLRQVSPASRPPGDALSEASAAMPPSLNITYLKSVLSPSPDTASLSSKSEDVASLQAGVVLVASTRPDLRRRFLSAVCRAAVERSMLVYSINPPGSIIVDDVPGVYQLTTHPTLSKRAILAALLRHGAQVLVFGLIATRDDITLMMEAVYTGYTTLCEIHGESPTDVLARLEALGVDANMLPPTMRIVTL